MSSVATGAVGGNHGRAADGAAVRRPPLLACSETPPTVAWFSTAFALTAYHCGAKPWSEPANVVGSPPISSRTTPSFSSASA